MRIRPAILAAAFSLIAAGSHALDVVNVYEIPSNVAIGGTGAFTLAGNAGAEPAPDAAPARTASATAGGTVWHSFSDLGNPAGTFAMDVATGASLRVDAARWGMPSADGARLLQRDYTSNGSSGVTRVTVRSRDGRLLIDHTMEGWLGKVATSPRDANVVLGAWGTSVTTPERRTLAYDLSRGKVLYATTPGPRPDALSWLPDGTLLRVQASGQVSQVTPGAGERPLGRVRWPDARVLQAVYASPDGRQVLLQLAALRDTGSVGGVDLWLMSVDGSYLRRFTKNDLVAEAFWSPDGRQVAFVKDTGVACAAHTCQGSCTVWVADASASDVVAVPASHDARQFRMKRADGSERPLGCPMQAWLA